MDLFPHDLWVQQVVGQGLQLTFTFPPPLRRSPAWIRLPSAPGKRQALRQEVQDLLHKQAIEVVRDITTPGFYSHLFLVPKPGGRWRPVIDLSNLNQFILAPHFRMETAQSVRNSVRVNEFAISLDLADAYLHIPVAPVSRQFLRFAIDGVVYAFRAMPFGLNIAPWVFTRLMETVMSHVRRSLRADISSYLDDILQKSYNELHLGRQSAQVLDLLRSLGWKVNLQKSDLTPSQEFVHLGMLFRTHLNLVCLTPKRLDKILTLANQTLLSGAASPRELQRLLGMLQAASELIPLGRCTLRTLQWAVIDLPDFSYADWDRTYRLTQPVLDAMLPWIDPVWLQTGVPLQLPPPQLTLCTDASLVGWGAHLLPEFCTVHGEWTVRETSLHINILEMLAVEKAMDFWLNQLRNLHILVMSDNTSVCAYIRNQGGLHSRELCIVTLRLLRKAHAANISVSVRHIPGRLNVIADSLSRRQPLNTEWTLHPEVFSRILERYPAMQIDLFATRFTRQMPQFVSPFPDDQALSVDGLMLDWSHKDLYAFPPTALVPLLIRKLEREPCRLTLVAPLQWRRSWTTALLKRTLEVPRQLPQRPDLLLQPASQSLHHSLEALNLHAWRLYGGPLKPGDSVDLQLTEFSEISGPLL